MRQFLWKAFQLTIFLSVVFSNIYFQWGADGYAASFLGLVAAAIATGIVIEISDRLLNAKHRLQGRRNGHIRRLTRQ